MALDDYVVTTHAERVVGQGILQESTTKNSSLGTELVLNDGRKFRYSYNGGVALAAGKCVQSPPWASDHESLATNTASKGDTTVTITNGATTAISLNDYADGYLIVETAGGAEVGIYKIKSHPAAAVDASCVITLYDPLRVAFAAGTTAALLLNPYNKVVVAVATGGTETGVIVGVPLIPVTINYYFWAQTQGPCNVLIDGTPAIGTPVMQGSVAGSVALATDAFKEIGTMMFTGVNTEYRPVMLDIA